MSDTDPFWIKIFSTFPREEAPSIQVNSGDMLTKRISIYSLLAT